MRLGIGEYKCLSRKSHPEYNWITINFECRFVEWGIVFLIRYTRIRMKAFIHSHPRLDGIFPYSWSSLMMEDV